mgnify:CR=1 FL=1
MGTMDKKTFPMRQRGYVCTAEEKARHSEKMKAWWAAKRLREGVKEVKKRSRYSDEERKNRSERKKAWWANERERMADSLPDRVEQREQKAKPRADSVSSITGRAIGAELRQKRDDKKLREPGESAGGMWIMKRIQRRVMNEMLLRTNDANIGKMELSEMAGIMRACQQAIVSIKQEQMVEVSSGSGFSVVVPGVPFEKTGEKRGRSSEDEESTLEEVEQSESIQ